ARSAPSPLRDHRFSRLLRGAHLAALGPRMRPCAMLLGATLWVAACVSPTSTEESSAAAILADNGIRLDNGLNLPNGFRLANGVRLANGIRLSNGLQVTNGVLAPNGIDIGNGIRLSNGFRLSNGVDLTGDVDGPFIAPTDD